MKILVLMPLDEKMVYNATEIYRNLPDEVKEITFAMPMFMQYLISTKTSPDWVTAVYDALISARNVCAAAESAKDDLIVIGNVDTSACKFDVVFNYQDAEEDLEYRDLLIEKLKSMPVVQEDPILLRPIAALHEAHESQIALMDSKATANFLGAYVKTGIDYTDIENQYRYKFKYLKEKGLDYKDGGSIK